MRNVLAGAEELHCGTPPRHPAANVNVINIDGIYIGKESDPSRAAQSFFGSICNSWAWLMDRVRFRDWVSNIDELTAAQHWEAAAARSVSLSLQVLRPDFRPPH